MVFDNISKFVSKKYNIGYIIFDENFKVIAFFNTHHFQENADIREKMFEIVGLEDEILSLKDSKDMLSFSMIKKENKYFDIDITHLKNNTYIIYLQEQDHSEDIYTHSIQEINERRLQEQTAHINNNVPYDYIVASTSNGFITKTNKQFLEFFNIKEEEIEKYKIFDFFKKKWSFLSDNKYICKKENKKYIFELQTIELFNKNTNITETVYIFKPQ
jgi:PAS domain-containing protein